MDNIKSEKAKEILKRSFDGGHISMDNAIAAVEAAERNMRSKAFDAFLESEDTDSFMSALK